MADPPATVGALILAAGAGRRMGGHKPRRLLQGRPILAHVLEACAQAKLPHLLVTGADPLADFSPHIVHADEAHLGLAHSLKAGLKAAPPTWHAALIVLADMPFVRPETLSRLASALQATPSLNLKQDTPPVVPTYRGRWGNPVGFARTDWPKLMRLTGDQGARKILPALAPQLIEVDDPGILQDLDTPADLQAI